MAIITTSVDLIERSREETGEDTVGVNRKRGPNQVRIIWLRYTIRNKTAEAHLRHPVIHHQIAKAAKSRLRNKAQ